MSQSAKSYALIPVVVLFSLSLPACKPGTEGGGGGSAGGTVAPSAETASEEAALDLGSRKTWDPALGTATIRGLVKYSGKPPRRRPIDMGAKPECSEQHSEKVLDESAVVSPEGAVENVFVWVSKGLEGWRYPVPKEAAVLDQKGCVYVPHVFGIQAGQPLLVRNSDPVLHNIHAYARRNKEFNFGQTQQGAEDTKVFKKPEVMVSLKCDVHGWMGAYLGVVDHPCFDVTDSQGAFELKNLPPGEYTVEAWHELFGVQEERVTLGDSETKTIEFLFEKP